MIYLSLEEPRMPFQEPYEDDDDYAERLERYHRDREAYEIECDRRVDEQREREAERRMEATE